MVDITSLKRKLFYRVWNLYFFVHRELHAPTYNRPNQANQMKTICQLIISLLAIHIKEFPINFHILNAQHLGCYINYAER